MQPLNCPSPSVKLLISTLVDHNKYIMIFKYWKFWRYCITAFDIYDFKNTNFYWFDRFLNFIWGISISLRQFYCSICCESLTFIFCLKILGINKAKIIIFWIFALPTAKTAAAKTAAACENATKDQQSLNTWIGKNHWMSMYCIWTSTRLKLKN